MKVLHHVATDVGRKRRDNEDNFLADAVLGLFVVADGMGGHAAGEVASRIAIEVVSRVVREEGAPQPLGDEVSTTDVTHPPVATDPDQTAPMLTSALRVPGPDVLRMAVTAANERVLEAAREKREHRGMAATVVALLFDGLVAHVAHAGDSRAYRLRGGVLEVLTADHSWVGEQIEKGALTPEDARTHPLRNMVTRAVGGRKDLEVSVSTIPIQVGDTYVLCSDGLTGMVPDVDIARLLLEAPGPAEAVKTLIDEANARGGHDNVTVLVIRLESDGA